MPATTTETTTPLADDLDQLLRGLKIPKIRAILGRELAYAEVQCPSYSDFLARLLREEYQSQQDRFMEHRIARARLPERAEGGFHRISGPPSRGEGVAPPPTDEFGRPSLLE